MSNEELEAIERSVRLDTVYNFGSDREIQADCFALIAEVRRLRAELDSPRPTFRDASLEDVMGHLREVIKSLAIRVEDVMIANKERDEARAVAREACSLLDVYVDDSYVNQRMVSIQTYHPWILEGMR